MTIVFTALIAGFFSAIGWNAGNDVSAQLASAAKTKPAVSDKYKHENSDNIVCGPDSPSGLR